MFDTLYDECNPLKKCITNRKNDPFSPWITRGLFKSTNKKDKLCKHYHQPPTNMKLQKFKSFKNKLNLIIFKLKQILFSEKFKNDMKRHGKQLRGTWGRVPQTKT